MNEINQEQNKVSCKLFDVQTASTVADCARLIEQGYEYVVTHSYGPNMGVTLFFRKPIQLDYEVQHCDSCDYDSIDNNPVCHRCEVTCCIRSNYKPIVTEGGSP